jgi:mRNA interferase MazF
MLPLAVVLPITSKYKGIPFHVEVNPPEAGLKVKSFIKCEDIRSVSIERFTNKWGIVDEKTIAEVEQRLRILIGL